MIGALKPRRKKEVSGEVKVPLDFPLVPEPDKVVVPQPETQETEPTTETEQAVVPPEPASPVVTGRCSRVTRKPIRYGDYKCYSYVVQSRKVWK